jgi:hypothetical protein
VDLRWNLIEERKESVQKGLPPEETTIRERCLAENCDVPDQATVKDFFRFVAATSRGLIDRETGKITADSLNTFGEWFYAGFTRVTKTATNEKEEWSLQYKSLTMRGERSHSEYF